MFTATTTSATAPDVTRGASRKADTPKSPVLITEQEVLLGTRIATAPARLSVSRRVLDTVRGAVHSLHLPPPHQHYPSDLSYLEHSRMAREMDRL